MRAETQTPSVDLLPPEMSWSDADIEGSVADRLLKVAAAAPDAPALIGGDGIRLTYGELRAAALALAEEIVGRIGDGPGRVAIYVDSHPSTVVAIFGILAAGKAYVPIDARESTERASAKLKHAEVDLLLAPEALTAPALELVGEERVLSREIRPGSESPVAPGSAGPDDLLNLVYTSGSTGLPKGVIQLQRNVLFETASGARDMETVPSDRFGLVMPLTFGASVSDMMGSLLNGAALHMFDLRRHGAAGMARWMLDEGINATHMVPTIFRRWMAEADPELRYTEMKAVKLGGEPVLHTDVAAFSRHFGPGCVLRNGLGTTETYLITSLFIRPGDTVDDGVVPVGHPVAGKAVSIRDDEGRQVLDGEIGHITAISDYLSPGYWKDEETTRQKYGVDAATGVRNYQPGDLGRIRPGDGMLEHLGRSDDMVKINGNQVEVGEVEAALLELPTIAEAAVVAQPSGDGSLRLVGYVVPSGEPVNQADLRTRLSARMPPHMVPTVFVEMESLPVLPFGKIDRRALPLPDSSRPELGIPYQAPSTEEERVIAGHAAEILRIDEVGVNDDLFALGMDSLLATRLVVMTNRSLGANLTVDTVLDFPTVAGVAQEVASSPRAAEEIDLEALVAELESGDRSGS